MFKYEGNYWSIIFYDTEIVNQVVYEGKFKLIGTSIVRAKKFEFAQVNHMFDYWGVKKVMDLYPSSYFKISSIIHQNLYYFEIIAIPI